MSAEVEIFKPGIAELRALAEKHRGLTINGIEDVEGYKAAKAARKELGDWRINITKAGKKYREEALAYQREVLRQEKEHLEIITPVENELKAKIEEVEEAAKREERRVLIPTRRALLADIGLEMTDEEIVSFDEKSFGELYTAKRMEFLEREAAAKLAKEDEERRAAELEAAKKEAAEKARIEAEQKAEREHQAEIDRIQREHQEAEEKRLVEEKKKADDEARAKREEEERIANEKAEQEKAEKNRRYKNWLKKHEVDVNDPSVRVEREGNTFTLWRKVDEITIA